MSELAVITGCSTGIGRATAVAFHEAGYETVATMRNPAAGEGLPCRVEALDVVSDESVDALFQGLPQVDVLVNNAGVGGPGSCEDTDVEAIRAVMEPNFYGAIRCARHVIPDMRERGSGTIVNVTSVAGRTATAMQGAYNASKFALEAWTETLAYEMVPFGVRVVLIEPGVVITPIFEKDYPDPTPTYQQAGDRLLNLLMSNTRHGTMPEHAAAVIFAAATSDEPRLRWTVGPDADQLIERHWAAPEADRLALFAEQDDEAFWSRFRELYGPEVAP